MDTIHVIMKEKLTILLSFCLQVITLIGCAKEDPSPTLKLAVLGGSISSSISSEKAKDIWRKELGIRVTTLGVSSAGFSAGTPTCVPKQIENAPPYDIYLFWASTNDMRWSIGDIGTNDPMTQNGGMRLAVQKIKEKNPKAIICLFTSLPTFTGANPKLARYVEGQKAMCDLFHIPYLDAHTLSGFVEENYTQYYLPDKLHLNEIGYLHLVSLQLEFLKPIVDKQILFLKSCNE